MNTVIVSCPEMPCPPFTDPADPEVCRITTRITAAVQAEMPDGSWQNGTVVFPATKIRKGPEWPLNSLVDQVTTEDGYLDDGLPIVITLAPERVIGPLARKVNVIYPSYIDIDGFADFFPLAGHFPAVLAHVDGVVRPVTAYLYYED
jgi:hypothetical protein